MQEKIQNWPDNAKKLITCLLVLQIFFIFAKIIISIPNKIPPTQKTIFEPFSDKCGNQYSMVVVYPQTIYVDRNAQLLENQIIRVFIFNNQKINSSCHTTMIVKFLYNNRNCTFLNNSGQYFNNITFHTKSNPYELIPYLFELTSNIKISFVNISNNQHNEKIGELSLDIVESNKWKNSFFFDILKSLPDDYDLPPTIFLLIILLLDIKPRSNRERFNNPRKAIKRIENEGIKK